jgi:aminoglycoside phosphotransferase (APT) family kinase protein
MSEDLPAVIAPLAAKLAGAPGRVERFRRLSGGASQETFSFDIETDQGVKGFILRRAPGGRDGHSETSLGLAGEARLLQAARAAGPFVPEVLHLSRPDDPIGLGYFMPRTEGETIARKILRDQPFEAARPKLARQCGEVLARIHALEVAGLPSLPVVTARQQIERYEAIYRSFDNPRAAFELAFAWLGDHIPQEAPPRLVHGDFRLGNLMIGPEGLRAVLDWELAHLGDPLEDLAWICTPSWRFGQIQHPVGGFGEIDDLVEGYEAAGGAQVDRARLKFWLLFGPLKWGVMCLSMYRGFLADRSVERAAIGRRASETEIDLVLMLETL